MSERTDSDLDRGRHVVLLVGAPGSGKSTLSRAIAARLTRSAAFSGDEVNRLIINGFVWALGEPHEEAQRQVDLTLAQLRSLARNFIDAGFTPVVEALFDTRDRLERFQEEFGGRLLLVVLDVDDATCRHRDAHRPAREQFPFDGHAGLRQRMVQAFGDRGWWLDTSALTVEESVDLILQQAVQQAGLSG